MRKLTIIRKAIQSATAAGWIPIYREAKSVRANCADIIFMRSTKLFAFADVVEGKNPSIEKITECLGKILTRIRIDSDCQLSSTSSNYMVGPKSEQEKVRKWVQKNGKFKNSTYFMIVSIRSSSKVLKLVEPKLAKMLHIQFAFIDKDGWCWMSFPK